MALVPDDPRQKQALVIGILAAAVFYFFWSYWYSPIKTEVVDMTARLEQLDSENNRAQIMATRGGTELLDRLAIYERHVVLLETLIPQSEEVSALLNEITTVSRQTGVEISTLAPEADQVGAFYTKQSYALEVVGDYHDLGRFFATISSLPRIITPVNMELTRFQGNRAVLEMDEPLTATVQIQTYILPASSAPPPGGSSGQQGGR
jgi:Tfp pilus assembly protein PilO